MTVAIPTRDRPDLFARALRSVVGSTASVVPGLANLVEIVVSDNASDPRDQRSYEVAEAELRGWTGHRSYVRHRPALGMVENFNACLEAARGDYVLVLHDDDYLLPGGLEAMLDEFDRAGDPAVVLFGVTLVDLHEATLKRQNFTHNRRLAPETALERVLTDSSFVRFPAIVVRRDAYAEVGRFDPSMGGPTDFDMWVRLFAHYGVYCSSRTIAAYTIHPGAATSSTFTPETISTLLRIFERVRRTQLLDEDRLRRSQAAFFHQFILGGTWRSLRANDRAAAARVMNLFSMPSVRALGPSARWLPLRAAFRALTVSVRPE